MHIHGSVVQGMVPDLGVKCQCKCSVKHLYKMLIGFLEKYLKSHCPFRGCVKVKNQIHVCCFSKSF
jgi:hypothetical protein